jgi:hypothetical protein
LIAYRLASIEAMAADGGLKLLRMIPGTWSRAHDIGVSEQDLVVFEAI